MSIQRLAREVKKIALRDNLSDAVVREALGHLKAVGSAEGAVDAAIEQLVHRARVAKRFPDLVRNTQSATAVGFVKTKLLQMGFAAHELKNLVPSGSTKPKSVPMKTPAPAPAKPKLPAKNADRQVPHPRAAQSILERKKAINEKLRKEEKGRTKSRASALTAAPSALDRKKAINEKLRKEENYSSIREAMKRSDAEFSAHIAAAKAQD